VLFPLWVPAFDSAARSRTGRWMHSSRRRAYVGQPARVSSTAGSGEYATAAVSHAGSRGRSFACSVTRGRAAGLVVASRAGCRHYP
jgi:hypothetical protein